MEDSALQKFVVGRYGRRRNTCLKKLALDARLPVTPSMPTSMTVELTTICNLKCVICFQRYDPPPAAHLSIELLGHVLPFIKAAEKVELFGRGEPIVSPSFWGVLKLLRGNTGAWVTTCSNGTVLNSDRIHNLLESPLRLITFSIDGARPETYRKIRGAELERTVGNVRELVKKRNEVPGHPLRVEIRMTLVRENIEEMVEFVELGAELGVDVVAFGALNEIPETNKVAQEGDWTFVYSDQYVRHVPEHMERMVQRTQERAQELGMHLVLDAIKHWPSQEMR